MVVGSALTLGAAARADTPSSDRIEADTARDLFRQGRDLYKKNQIPEARAKFLAAWGVKKHWQIALNLGATELLLSRYREAAEHLTWADRESAGAPEDADIRWLHQRLPEALAQVARLKVVADPGLELRIDDEPPRTTPVADALFLDPGHHEVSVQGPGHPVSTVSLDLVGGETRQLDMTAPPEVPVLPGAGLPAEQATEPPPADSQSSDAKLVVLITGSALTVVSLGLGFYFSAQANAASSDADRLRMSISQQPGGGSCAVPSELCSALSDAVYNKSAWEDRARFAYITSGTLAVVTAGAYFLWPKSEPETAKRSLQFGGNLRGVWVKGTF